MALKLTIPKFSEWTRSQRLLAFGGMLLWSVVMLDRFVLKPWGDHAAHVRKEIARLEEDMRRDRRLLDRKAEIFGDMQAYRGELAGAGAAATDMASLIREIEGLGRESGLQLGGVKPLEGTPEQTAYTVDVEYQGTLQQWVHFIFLLEQSKSLLQIERATVGRQAEGSGLMGGSVRVSSQVNRESPA